MPYLPEGIYADLRSLSLSKESAYREQDPLCKQDAQTNENTLS